MTQTISFKLSKLVAEFIAVLPDCRFESDCADPIITDVTAIEKGKYERSPLCSQQNLSPVLEIPKPARSSLT